MIIYFDNIKVFNEIKVPKDHCNFFVENNYVILKNVLTLDIKKYLKTNITFNKPHTDVDNPIKDSRQFYREHHDKECTEFINRFYNTIQPFYEYILNKKLTKFLGFSMKYNQNSELVPHYDNYNMPISSTICFYNEDQIDYPLYIDKSYFNNPHPFRLTVDDKNGIPEQNKIKINITDGDLVIFRGRNHLHWRDKKFIKDYRALLLHTEDYTYNGELISYIHSENVIKADINNIKNINTYALTDMTCYDTFRKDYAMFFENS
tara:strand:+ start:5176 stop:5961 length:786 start_codon:yes stop_codon:yes gene_type:complete